jgi:hypothetical protein
MQSAAFPATHCSQHPQCLDREPPTVSTDTGCVEDCSRASRREVLRNQVVRQGSEPARAPEPTLRSNAAGRTRPPSLSIKQRDAACHTRRAVCVRFATGLRHRSLAAERLPPDSMVDTSAPRIPTRFRRSQRGWTGCRLIVTPANSTRSRRGAASSSNEMFASRRSPKVRSEGCPLEPIASACAKSGSVRAWRISALGAGPRASRRSRWRSTAADRGLSVSTPEAPNKVVHDRPCLLRRGDSEDEFLVGSPQ